MGQRGREPVRLSASKAKGQRGRGPARPGGSRKALLPLSNGLLNTLGVQFTFSFFDDILDNQPGSDGVLVLKASCGMKHGMSYGFVAKNF